MTMEKGIYTKYAGQETEVLLPEYVDNHALAIIGSKAFLSCKTVERLVLPPTVESVMDWGFAHMKNLREIVMPAGDICFGRQVFLGCDRLQRVVLYSVKKYRESAEIHILEEISGLDGLRASMFRFFPQESVGWLEDGETTDGQKRWLGMYDEALAEYLCKPDDDGFVPAFIGWFDVEDVDDQKQGYLHKVRKDKIALAFQRMNCAEEPREPQRQLLHNVIAERPVLVREFLEEHPECGRDICYYKIWWQSGGLERTMVEALLTHLPWEEPEIRAYLMKLLKPGESEDFFAQLEL